MGGFLGMSFNPGRGRQASLPHIPLNPSSSEFLGHISGNSTVTDPSQWSSSVLTSHTCPNCITAPWSLISGHILQLYLLYLFAWVLIPFSQLTESSLRAWPPCPCVLPVPHVCWMNKWRSCPSSPHAVTKDLWKGYWPKALTFSWLIFLEISS